MVVVMSLLIVAMLVVTLFDARLHTIIADPSDHSGPWW